MGQKIHPIGVRLGITREPHSFWYAKGKQYGVLVEEDTVLRNYIFQRYRQSRVSGIDIERRKEGIRLRIESSKTKLLVGTNGQELENLTHKIKKKCFQLRKSFSQNGIESSKEKVKLCEKCEMQVFVRQVPCPHSNAKCVADFIALELEKRTPFRRVMRIAGDRISNLDHILGFRLQISGRLNGAEIARIEFIQKGRVPLHTFSSDLDYESIPARTIYGLLGIKIWISLLRNKETTS